MSKADAVLLVAFCLAAIAAVFGWFASRNSQNELEATTTEFRTCQGLANQILAAKGTALPHLIVSPQRDLAKWSLDFLEYNGAEFDADVFSAELPPTSIPGTDLELVLVSVPAISLSLPQLASILNSATTEEYPGLITRIQLQNAGLREDDQTEVWKTSLGLTFVRRQRK